MAQVDRTRLVAGTRPQITDGRILLTGADGFDGYEITHYLGMSWGISVRAKDVGQDCAMGCKQFTGGELSSYTSLADESRQSAIDRMLTMARSLHANAVINVTFELGGAATGGVEVVATGTAVYIQPIVDYVPEGAVGNILADIHDKMP